MTVESFLDSRPGGYYCSAPSRLARYRRYSLTGTVWSSRRGLDLYELRGPRGGVAVLGAEKVMNRTARKRGGEWRIRFFPNDMDRAREIRPDTYDKRLVAFHEAGHAVAAWSLGRSLTSAEVKPSSSISDAGKLELQLGSVGYDRVTDESAAVIGIAGPLAEAAAGGEFNVDGSDLVHVVFGTGSDGTKLREAQERASAILTDNWPIVTKIAQALILEAELDSTRLTALLST